MKRREANAPQISEADISRVIRRLTPLPDRVTALTTAPISPEATAVVRKELELAAETLKIRKSVRRRVIAWRCFQVGGIIAGYVALVLVLVRR